jgi:hypothetical protein
MNPASLKHFITGIFFLLFIQVSIAQEASNSKIFIGSTENSDGKTHRHRMSFGVYDFNVEYRGTVEVTDDDRDIKSLSDDGYVEISKTVFGSKRGIIIESLGGGKLKKEYYEGRSKIDWEPKGREWLNEILPSIVRSTGLGAEGRINRYYAKGGVPAVMSEISRLEGDYVRTQYGKLLFKKEIPNAELPSVITGLSDEIDSDYYLSTLYKDNIEKLLSTNEAADAFFKGSAKISSDYYKSVVLKEALNKYSTSPAQAKVILQSAKDISSAYYLHTVLVALLDQRVVKEEALNEMVLVSKDTSSDYYRSVVLNRVLKLKGVSKVTLKNIADALSDIGSDYYKSTVLKSMATHTSMDEATQSTVLGLIDNSMNSDYYASVVLSEFLKNQKLTDKTFSELVMVAGKLNSANYAADVLGGTSDVTLSKPQLIEICKASANISSDYYLSTVLTSIAPQIRSLNDAEVKDAYRQAAKRIDSETYFGRAIRAIE